MMARAALFSIILHPPAAYISQVRADKYAAHAAALALF